jgi:hypothetical protein
MLFHGGMAVFALLKLSQRPDERVPGRKWMWAVVIATNLAASSVFSWGRLVAPPPKPESDWATQATASEATVRSECAVANAG